MNAWLLFVDEHPVITVLLAILAFCALGLLLLTVSSMFDQWANLKLKAQHLEQHHELKMRELQLSSVFVDSGRQPAPATTPKPEEKRA